MLKNYLKVGWRNIVKHRTFSFINIAGLAAGLTCFAYIALWVFDEMSYDKFNRNYKNIARVTTLIQTISEDSHVAVTGASVSERLKIDFPEVLNSVRLKMRGDIVTFKNQQFYQPGILMADPSFFDVFTFELLEGDKATALNSPYSIILTKSAAEKYFGKNDPMGETMTINLYDGSGYGALYKVTGIMADPPSHSHFNFTMLASFKTIETANPDVLSEKGWANPAFYTYLLLRDDADLSQLATQVTRLYKGHGDSSTPAVSYSYRLQPISEIHLRSHLQSEVETNGDIHQVYLFSAIGIFVLLIAGINYVNLAIAGSIKRAKEVGVKKVIGAAKAELVTQYLLESVLTACIAFLVALLLSLLLKPQFLQLTGKDLLPVSSPTLVIFLFGVSVLLGILSGVYPAIVLSGLKPVRILKGDHIPERNGISVRAFLMVAQFMLTTVLVTGIIGVNSQMKFMKNKELGYDKEGLLFLRIHGNTEVIKGFPAFRNELLSNPLIVHASTTNTVPVAGLELDKSETVDTEGKTISIISAVLRTDSFYLSTYGLRVVAGKNFHNNPADSLQPFIINEAAVRAAGWYSSGDAIGKPYTINGVKGEVVGVVNDFHFSSMHDLIKPLAIYPNGERFSRLTLKANLSDPTAALAWIQSVWKKHFPSALLDYEFVDRQVGAQYVEEERFADVVFYFSLLSVLIACLGLHGLVSHAVLQKVKEIGIRKILGASVNGIALMLSSEFFKLVLLSALLAAPVAWYAMHRWLENFAYKTPITWWMFALSGLLVMCLSMLTVSFQVIRSARVSPVKNLR